MAVTYLPIVLIPGGVYQQTADEMHGAVPILLLSGLVVIVPHTSA